MSDQQPGAIEVQSTTRTTDSEAETRRRCWRALRAIRRFFGMCMRKNSKKDS